MMTPVVHDKNNKMMALWNGVMPIVQIDAKATQLEADTTKRFRRAYQPSVPFTTTEMQIGNTGIWLKAHQMLCEQCFTVMTIGMRRCSPQCTMFYRYFHNDAATAEDEGPQEIPRIEDGDDPQEQRRGSRTSGG